MNQSLSIEDHAVLWY